MKPRLKSKLVDRLAAVQASPRALPELPSHRGRPLDCRDRSGRSGSGIPRVSTTGWTSPAGRRWSSRLREGLDDNAIRERSRRARPSPTFPCSASASSGSQRVPAPRRERREAAEVGSDGQRPGGSGCKKRPPSTLSDDGLESTPSRATLDLNEGRIASGASSCSTLKQPCPL